MKPIRWLGLALLLCASLAGAQTLRWASRSDTRSMDPHTALEAVTFNLNSLVYDALVEFDKERRYVPALATRWEIVSPTVWRFELRRDVRFQDGSLFTAADAVFSIERAQQPGSDYAAYAQVLGKPVAIDEHTLELRQDRPDPILLEHLRFILIMSKAWCLEHQAQQVPDLKAGQDAWSNRHAMGTGRFRLVANEPSVRTLFERNPQWWGRFEGNVQRLSFQPIANDATRVAALIAGDIDFMQDVPPQSLGALAAEKSVTLLSGPEIRLIFLSFDGHRDELLYSSVKGRNPFKDLRVRQAFSLAIDAQALKQSVMRGQSEPTACFATSRATCQVPALDKPAPPNLALARQLLAQAGFPQGFALTIDCPNDRYINDQAICVAVSGMLARIGITPRVDARGKAQYFNKLQQFDTSFYLLGFGVMDAQLLFDSVVHGIDPAKGKGSFNYGRWSDAEIDRAIDALGTEMDTARRNVLIGQVQQLLADRHALLPLHRQMLTWAARSKVHALITPDNMVRADWIRVE